MRTIIFLCFLLAGLSGYMVTHQLPYNDKKPVSVEYFKQGQILPPEGYGCTDTLIVKDAKGLNEAMGSIEQGFTGQDFRDAQYDSLFYVYCDVKTTDHIIKSGTDERGFTSVVFTEGKDTFGLDYLDKHELDSLKSTFK